MKNIYFTGILLLLSLNLFSQDEPLNFGLKAGVDIFKFASNESFDKSNSKFDYKVGYFIGGYLNITIDDKFKIQPEAQIFFHNRTEIIQNLVFRNDNTGVFVGNIGGSNVDVREQILYIPILVQYSLTSNTYLELGPQVGYSLNKKIETNENTFEVAISDDFEIYDYTYDTFDFGFSMGMGSYLSKSIGFNLRYFIGLTERDSVVRSSQFSLGIDVRI